MRLVRSPLEARDSQSILVIGAVLGVCCLIGWFSAALGTSSIYETSKVSILILVNFLVLSSVLHVSYSLLPGSGLRNPALILVGFLMMLYVARPAYIILTGEAGTHQIGEMRFEIISRYFVSTLALSSIMLSAFAIGYAIAPISFLKTLLSEPRVPRPGARLWLVLLLTIGAAAAAAVVADLAAYPGGWQAGLAVRASFFEGRNYLIIVMNLFRTTVLVWTIVLVARPEQRRPWSLIIVTLLWIASIFIDSLSGGRAELILRNIFPWAMVVSLLPTLRARSRSSGLLLVSTSILLFVGYRSFVRDRFSGDNLSPFQRIVDNIRDFPRFILGGDESAAFDYLVALRMSVPSEIPYRGIDTIWSVLASSVPSALLADKPIRTGEYLTRALRPDLADRGGSIAFSGAGDLYYSFGLVAVPIGFFLFGWTAGALIKPALQAIRNGASPAWPVAFGFVAAAALLSILRAELAELTLVVIRIGMLIGCYCLLTMKADAASTTDNSLRRES